MQKNNIVVVLMALFLSSCLGGGSDGGFADLVGGDLSDVDELTIISTTPSGNTVTIDVGDDQAFTILAETPPPATVSYYFTANGTNVSNTNSVTIEGENATNLPLDQLGVGNHTVTATATDGTSSKSKSWTVKVNGPPSVTSGYSTPPKVSVGSTLNLAVTATDPNGDAMTYTWEINGAVSGYLVATDDTAVLTADVSLLAGGLGGEVTIDVTAEDTEGATTTHSFDVEINGFNSSCNSLAQFEMCTYVGTPSLGDGNDPDDPSESALIKIAPIALAIDARNDNLIIADYVHNLIWYWNRTAAAVNFLQFDTATAIPANTIKVVAGTGAAATESGDTSLNVAVNAPRGLYYDDDNDRLYISEWGASRVKLVNSTGVTSYPFGVGAGHTDGTAPSSHACANPAGMSYYTPDAGVTKYLVIACYSSHRVKMWNLTANTVDTIYGASSGTSANFRNDRSAPEFAGASYGAAAEDGQAYAACAADCGYPNPYDVHYDADGLYVTHPAHHYIRYCNFSGGARNILGVNIGNGFCRNVIGDGTAAYGASGATPRTKALRDPYAIVVDNRKIIASSLNSDRIVLINTTGAGIGIGDYGIAIADNEFQVISGTGAGYSEGAGAVSKAYNDIYDIILEPDGSYTRSYLIADYSNRRIRRANYGANITTSLIGNGRVRGDNVGTSGLASEFYMNLPSGITYDSRAAQNSIFVADTSNARILKIDGYGNVTAVVGGGANLPSAVSGAQSPTSITLTLGVTTIVDLAMFNDYSILINNSSYSHLQVWNRSGSTRAYLNASTTGNDKINQVAGNYNLPDSAVAGNYDDDATSPMLVSLANPSGIAISENSDSTKEVFITDEYRHCIRRVYEVTPGTTYGMDTVVGVCKDGSQPSNTNPPQAQGGGGTAIDSAAPLTEILFRPTDIEVHHPTSADATDGGGVPASLNGKGNLVIAEYNGNKIRYWNRSGTAVEFAGVTIANNTIETIGCTTGSSNTTENILSQGSQCSNIVGLAINDDYLCYSQWGKHNVRCIYLSGANEGRVFTAAGSRQSVATGLYAVPYNFDDEGATATWDGGTGQRLYNPTGLVFDSNGDLFITDYNNHIVKKVKLSP